ncbi:hypothetical protein [Zavarzinella formosa]|uniref:hypothetical protein n=1 Tax=Zavarzinella formosa TaxID=360055 RepID=UPI0012F9DFA3|nr:hypothetical protein [Zavarzinella formosa]
MGDFLLTSKASGEHKIYRLSGFSELNYFLIVFISGIQELRIKERSACMCRPGQTAIWATRLFSSSGNQGGAVILGHLQCLKIAAHLPKIIRGDTDFPEDFEKRCSVGPLFLTSFGVQIVQKWSPNDCFSAFSGHIWSGF